VRFTKRRRLSKLQWVQQARLRSPRQGLSASKWRHTIHRVVENQEALGEVREDLVEVAALLVLGAVALEEKVQEVEAGVAMEKVVLKDYFKSLMKMLNLSETSTKL